MICRYNHRFLATFFLNRRNNEFKRAESKPQEFFKNRHSWSGWCCGDTFNTLRWRWQYQQELVMGK